MKRMAIFILETYNTSGRLWSIKFNALFSSSFNLSRTKIGRETYYTSGRTESFGASLDVYCVFMRNELNDQLKEALLN